MTIQLAEPSRLLERQRVTSQMSQTMSVRSRINFVTPLPPLATEIANHSALVLRALTQCADVVTWTDQAFSNDAIPGGDIRRFTPFNVPAAELAAADATFYNIGNNSRFHTTIWEASRRVPGVVILHDTCLQNLFAGFATTPSGTCDYVGMMGRYYGASGRQDGLALVRGQVGILDMMRRYPLTAGAMDNSRGVIIHNEAELSRIRSLTTAPVWYLPLAGAGSASCAPRMPGGQGPHRLVVFGHIGPNRCVDQIIEALAAPELRGCFRLDVFGEAGEPGLLDDAIARNDLGDAVTLHGYVPERVLDEALSRASLAINLRNPSVGEASASQLRIWANGLPSLVSQTGWYESLPEGVVHFVRLGHEQEDLRRHLAAFLAEPEPYRMAGLAGQAHVDAVHGAASYAQALVDISRELSHPRGVAMPAVGYTNGSSRAVALEGNAEVVTGELIAGWAGVSGRSDLRVTVRMFLGESFIAETVADEFRDDLKQAGKGDGRSGFTIRIPAVAQGPRYEPLRLFASWADAHLMLSEDTSIRFDPPQAEIRTPMLYLDVTDLLIYSMTSRTVSGIQRVQLGYIANWCRQQDRSAAIRFVIYSVEHRHFCQVADEDIAWLLDCLSYNLDVISERQKRLQAIVLAAPARPFEPAHGDTLLVTGNFWSFPHFHRALQLLQANAGLHYVQLFYDAVPTIVPETCPPEAAPSYSRALARMLQQADAVVAISHFSAGELRLIASRLSVVCPQVEVVPMGTEPRYGEEVADDADLPPDLGDFVLCVGTIEPRKNHLYLFNIWRRLLSRGGRVPPKLVCAGRFGWFTDELRRHLQAHGDLDGHFVTLAEVTDAQLRALYRHCRFTIYPSTYEGWGLPVSESLSAGRLCVTSNVTAMPEAGGKWSAYLDPFDINDGYRVITQLLDDPALVAEMEAAIRREFQPTSWAAASDQFWDALQRIGGVAGLKQRRHARPPVLSMHDHHRLTPALGMLTTPLAVARNEVGVMAFEHILHGADWHPTEIWGAWARGRVARLVFRTETIADDEVVGYIRVGLPDNCTGLACRVMVNDVEVLARALSPSVQALRVPLGSGGFVRMDVVLDDDVVVPNDARRLGLGFHSLFVCRAGDVAARLAFLEG